MHHIWEVIRFKNSDKLVPVFDRDRPIRSTGDMMTWHTSKPCAHTKKSHINFCVYDSSWEASEAFKLENSSRVLKLGPRTITSALSSCMYIEGWFGNTALTFLYA
jgi:hypothetical protein